MGSDNRTVHCVPRGNSRCGGCSSFGIIHHTIETEYTYDRLGQLSRSEFSDNIDNSRDRTVTYTYDIDGNRIERTEGNVVTENTFAGQAADTFMDYHHSNGMVSFVKDENGYEKLRNHYTPEGSIIAAENFSGSDQGLYVYTKDICS